MVNFSVIVPLADETREVELKNCISNLKKQSLKPFEIIFVVGPNAKKSLFNILGKERKVKIVKKNLKKAEARNYGAKCAKGNFLVHIDVNDSPGKDTLRQAQKLIKRNKAEAIIMHEDIRPTSYIARIRKLERKINIFDPFLATPQIIEASLFKKVKGFDEDTDILDDWSLHFRLISAGVKFYATQSATYIDVETNLLEVLRRKFRRGQFIPMLKLKYPEYAEIKNVERLGIYLKNAKILLSDPPSALGLIVLKPIEWIAFFLGTLNPAKHGNGNLYGLGKIAKGFDREQKSPYSRYKHYTEVNALSKLLPSVISYQSSVTILELGAGTGRITEELAKKGFKVTPTDISPAMLKVYRTKIRNYLSESKTRPSRRPSLPNPTLLKPGSLPYKDSSFDYVIAIRVVWHISDKDQRQEFLKEAIRVAKRAVIIDFAIKNRGLNRFFKNDYYFTEGEIKKLAARFGAKMTGAIPLPLGRLLIRFDKNGF